MTEQPRDWDKELAEIDRAIAKQGSGTVGQTGGGVVSRSPAPPLPAPAGRQRRGSVAVTWLWVLLAVGLAAALPLWPYQHACGLQAAFFVGAAGITALVGGLAALSSWATRRGFAHVVSLLVIGWAVAIAAREILPRVGYAREARSWSCEALPAPAGQPAPPAPGAGPAGPAGVAAPTAAPSPAAPSEAGSSSTAPSTAAQPQGTTPAPGATDQP